ncbi:glycoside hydrolase family 78 protein [Panus rudis PR-1116 ss-1]|nr:glycoside hydrolase family 78 protein [Panus rudis PR-1116 ss-1]
MGVLCHTLICALFLGLTRGLAPHGPWDAFIYAPNSRTVLPKSIRTSAGDVRNLQNLLFNNGTTVLSGKQSYVTLDFGIEIGGVISLHLDEVTAKSAFALSFTESALFISAQTSDDSASSAVNMSYDGALHAHTPLQRGLWAQPRSTQRGGFRFLTIVSKSEAPITFSNLSCALTFMPHVEDLRAYSGYFFAKDPSHHDAYFLTKIWYAGAYTVQLDTISAFEGRQGVPSPGWANNATIGVASPVLVDGAKRDRTIWPGDMGVAVPTEFVSTNDLLPARNSLATMFSLQDPDTGGLPYSGPVLNFSGSDTYHAWTLIGAYNYYLYTGDTVWVQSIWANYTKGVKFLLNKIDSTGLVNVTGTADWGRVGGGGHGSVANALLYRVLLTGATMASDLNHFDLAETWSANAMQLKTRYNEVLWLPEVGMYRDNDTTTLTPQDGNSLALLYNLTNSSSQASSISGGLTKNWNEIGAIAPELPDTIAPFIGSFEIQAHFESGNDLRAMDLLRREWGYMLYTNLSVQSSLLEGYTSNGSLYYRSDQGYNFDSSYTSHAHGWSTGPTSALTFYVLGLAVTSPKGRTWSFAPHLSGLSAAQGGFETPLGWFEASWTLNNHTKSFEVSLEAPANTTGSLRLPASVTGQVTIDGRNIRDSPGIVELSGGKHSIHAQIAH